MAHGFPEQAVQLPHLAHGRLGPAVLGDDCLYLLSKRRDTLGHRSEIIQGVCDALIRQDEHQQGSGWYTQSNTHGGGGVDGREVDEEDPLDDIHVRVVPGVGFVQDPLEHIILMSARGS